MNKAFAEWRKKDFIRKMYDPDFLVVSYERQKINILKQKEKDDEH